ncbi:MAG: hypothetical protein R6T98_16585 [Desulfatiglandales bacterium]
MTKCESQVLMCASIAFATAASRNQGNSDHHRNKYPHNDASSDAVCQDLGEMQKDKFWPLRIAPINLDLRDIVDFSDLSFFEPRSHKEHEVKLLCPAG